MRAFQVEENILKKANQKRMLGQLAIEGGGFTTDFFSGDNLTALFDSDVVAGAADANTSDTSPSKKDAPKIAEVEVEDNEDEVAVPGTPSKQDLLKAMAAVEDESDQQAAVGLQKEQERDGQEFDEAKPLVEDSSKAASSTSEAESSIEDEAQVDLKAQMDRLRGVELHALAVLERYGICRRYSVRRG